MMYTGWYSNKVYPSEMYVGPYKYLECRMVRINLLKNGLNL